MPQRAERSRKNVASLGMVGVTDPGRVRPENEDAIGVHPDVGLAILADGMGGHQAGEVASGMAVNVITRHFAEAFMREVERKRKGQIPQAAMEVNAMYDAVQLANNAIFEMARIRPECAGMGSTVVIAVFYDDKICMGHVGDSRLYRYRAGELTQLTQDHSVVQELVSRGLLTIEEAHQTVGKNLVTRALGVDSIVAPDVAEQPLEESDLYLICSDGLNDMLSDEEIRKLLVEHGTDLQAAANRLVAEANERGGADNVSVILVRAAKRFARPKKAVQELQRRIKQA
jgi:serine/threonine protein phosphatase PrpC